MCFGIDSPLARFFCRRAPAASASESSARGHGAMTWHRLKIFIPLLAAAVLSGCVGAYNLKLSMAPTGLGTLEASDVDVAVIVPAATVESNLVKFLPSRCIDLPIAPVPYGALFRQTV